ncbi:MAG TPA: hypothetical protein VGP72_00690 [Planctomycetota bacterium]|jgi:hypothetical protein
MDDTPFERFAEAALVVTNVDSTRKQISDAIDHVRNVLRSPQGRQAPVQEIQQVQELEDKVAVLVLNFGITPLTAIVLTSAKNNTAVQASIKLLFQQKMDDSSLCDLCLILCHNFERQAVTMDTRHWMDAGEIKPRIMQQIGWQLLHVRQELRSILAARDDPKAWIRSVFLDALASERDPARVVKLMNIYVLYDQLANKK